MHPTATPPPRAAVLALLALLLMVPLAGCLDKEETPSGSDATEGTDGETTTGSGIDGNEAPDPDAELDNKKEEERETGTAERVPAAHYHHYWGNPALDDALLFRGTVELDYEACQPDRFGEQRPACLGSGEVDIIESHIGSVTFTPEDDGDDVPSNDDPAINSENKADSVLVGTNLMDITISWQDPNVGDLLFFYKPGNTNQFLPTQSEEYQRVENGATFALPVTPRAADPAHQVAVSRWAFRLVADGGPSVADQPWPFPTKYGAGEIDVEIIIRNGGESAIAPPHPDPWAGGERIDYEKIEGDFTATLASGSGMEDGAEDIAIPAIPKQVNIVPAGTSKLVVKAWVNASLDTMDTMNWGLKWHGADTTVYADAPQPSSGDDGALVFEIPVDEVSVDPPYEAESYYRFGFYPIAGDQAYTGHYEASYTLIVSAHKDPEFTYYF